MLYNFFYFILFYLSPAEDSVFHKGASTWLPMMKGKVDYMVTDRHRAKTNVVIIFIS